MPPAIVKGSRAHCLEGLQQGRPDLSEFPLRTYTDLDVFTILDQEVPIFQGVNTVPQERFIVSLEQPAAAQAGLAVPGVVPFLVSAYQVSARRRISSPHPTEVGLPLLTTETEYLIRWMFGRDGDRQSRHTLWRRLSETELQELLSEVRPDAQIEPTARATYQSISGAIAAPEPPAFVQPRAGGLPHEPWLARSVELAEQWRVVVPNTSISCRPVIVPPTLTIIGQNFNVLLCPSAEIALAIGAVLSRSEPLEYLIGISPWSQGDTPRPRSKHVTATLWSFREHIQSLLTEESVALSLLAEQLAEVWRLHIATAISLARGQHALGTPLRDCYRAIEPREGLNLVPLGLESLQDHRLTLKTADHSVHLEFSTPEEAALAAVTTWTAIPQGLAIGNILALRFEPGLCSHPDAVRDVLFQNPWGRLIGETQPTTETERLTEEI